MKKNPPAPRRKIQKVISIPDDVILAPQTEMPKHLLGTDRSGSKSRVRELSWVDFNRLVQSMARAIRKSFKPQAVVGVAHGGVFVGGAVASALGCDFYPVRISRRSRDKVVRKNPRMFGEMPAELKNQRVLVVDDVAASGDTLELARQLALKVRATEVLTACLVCRQEGFAPDFAGLTTEDFVVFPWDYESVAEDARFDVDPDKAGA